MLQCGLDMLKSCRFDEAAEVFETCIAASIAPAKAHAALGWCLLGNGHNLQASVNFKKSLNLTPPGNWETWLGLGRAYKNMKQKSLAVEAFKNSLKLKKSISTIQDLSFCLNEMGRYREAIGI